MSVFDADITQNMLSASVPVARLVKANSSLITIIIIPAILTAIFKWTSLVDYCPSLSQDILFFLLVCTYRASKTMGQTNDCVSRFGLAVGR